MSKKEQERPRFRCDKCGCIWVYHEPICIVCGAQGIALNKRAERILKKGVMKNDRGTESEVQADM